MSLVRKLKNGKKYNALIPYSSCERVSFGEGDTFYSVEKIATQALQHSNQVAKLAKVLKQEAKNGTLQEIANTIHSFLYWHLQYKADGEAQLLRSPACAWQQRYDGVDCKSYSIFASAILLQLGIKHYIRQIKQANLNPNDYTHVYVVVPKNQSSGSLKDGYYTIDGTLQHTNEPIYLTKDDTFMNRLPHYGLNGLRSGSITDGTNTDYGSSDAGTTEEDTSTTVWDSISGWFDGVSFNTPFDCWGGSSYDSAKAKKDISNFTARLSSYLDGINIALIQNNFVEMARLVNLFIGDATYNASIAGYKRADQSWNSCSRDNIDTVWKYFSFYRYNIVKSLKVWLDEYFNTTIIDYKYFGNTNLTGQTVKKYYIPNDVAYSASESEVSQVPVQVTNVYFADWVSYDSNDGTYLVFQVPLLEIQPKATQIPQFEVTEVMMQSNNDANLLTPENILNSLQNIVSDYQNGGSSSSNYDNQNPNNPYQTATPTTQKAGFGYVGGVLISGAVLKLAWDYLKNKKQK